MKTLLRLAVGLLLLPAFNLPAATHYVSQQGWNGTPPYSNWATAAPEIQQAVDVAAAGDVVMVTDGLYSRVVVTNPLALVSVNGPQSTIIMGGRFPNPYGPCVNLSPGASLCGFTLTNGNGFSLSGGLSCASKNAFVTNCLIVGNSSGKYGGGGGGVRGYTLQLHSDRQFS